MKKIIIILILMLFSSAYADGHLTKKQKQETLQCLGHYTATGVLPADSIELKDLEMALASAKVVRTFLQNEKVNNDEINKGMNEYVDKVFGKPFDNSMNNKCNKFIYKLIPGSKEEIEKLSRTIYGG
jgi:hypothetical protein